MKPGLFTSAAYAELFIRGSRHPPQALLAGSGLSPQDLSRQDYIAAEHMSMLLANIEALGAEPGWAARAGAQLSINTHGPLGFAALSAPTLGAALQVMAEFYPVRLTTITAELEQVGQRYRFAMTDLTGDTRYAYWMFEAVLRVLESLIETIVGHPVGENVAISFAYPAPDYADVLEDIYGTPCEFGTSHTSISIPASWRHIPSPLYDESTYRANIAKCREIIAAQDQGDDPVQRVRNILASHFDLARAGESFDTQPPGLEAIAERMHLTSRTLIRRLKRAGNSYKQLLEEARRDSAEALLQQAGLTVADVGELLGYRDPANFGRAFRKWTGMTPAAWRRGLRSRD
jgi:AraC-like DNA-binding protein